MAENSKIERQYGPKPLPPRDGDKVQARQRINVEVRTGKRPHPNDLPCVDCGHIWVEGERRHEYDHHLGYSSAHHYDVEAVCTLCHSKRDGAKANQQICSRGHLFNAENTGRTAQGRRFCRECRRVRDRGRRNAEFWRNYRATRRQSSGTK